MGVAVQIQVTNDSGTFHVKLEEIFFHGKEEMRAYTLMSNVCIV